MKPCYKEVIYKGTIGKYAFGSQDMTWLHVYQNPCYSEACYNLIGSTVFEKIVYNKGQKFPNCREITAIVLVYKNLKFSTYGNN